MRTVRVSDVTGRYAKGILSAGVFTPEQTRYLEEELEKIVAVVANYSEALIPRSGDEDQVLVPPRALAQNGGPPCVYAAPPGWALQ